MNKHVFSLIVSCFFLITLQAQQITGHWQGRIGKRKVELKVIQKGDSLLGTSYYYDSPRNYQRYSIKGYFDGQTNAAVWWDDQLLEETVSRPGGKTAMRSEADFNCPGGGKMFLEGEAKPKQSTETVKVDLTKTDRSLFEDEWDFIIDNYTVGANHPDLIDSVALIAYQPVQPEPARAQPAVLPEKKTGMVVIPPMPEPKATPEEKQNITQKFQSRKKTFKMEIPVTADFIELRFYDNAQVDGDSISLFLDDRMIFTHIRLTEQAYVVKLAAKDLQAVSELTMVAENLGSIPPNTSFMVALVGNQRYEAQLASTENSSAMIRLRKE